MEQSNILTVASAYNNEDVLKNNLLASPDIFTGIFSCIVEPGLESATKTYNVLINKINAEYIVFAHQDVYFPPGWFNKALNVILRLNEELNGQWLALGSAGVSMTGEIIGHVWSSSINRLIGGAFQTPIEVQSLDELVIIVNTKHFYGFDDKLPFYHLYGTDIVQEGINRGLKSFVADLPAIHNDKLKLILGKDYLISYKYMKSKWKDKLPIYTTTIPLKKFLTGYYIHCLKRKRIIWLNKVLPSYQGVSSEKSKELGFEL